MIDQVPSLVERFSPLRGAEAERQAASDIDPDELNVTTDQQRWFLGTAYLPPTAHHTAVDQAARLALHASSARGCWEGDTAYQSDDGKTYKCISGNGTSVGQWVVLGSPVDTSLSASSTNAVENRVVKAALDGKSNTGHTHSYNSLTNIPSEFVPEGHLHDLSEIVDSGTAAGRNVPSSGDAASDECVIGSDTRLSDSRPPTGHGHVVADVSDAGTAATKDVASSGNAASNQVVKGDDTRLTDSRPPTSHGHVVADVSDAGTAATKDVASSGNAASDQVVKGDDTRLTDARPPESHGHSIDDVSGLGTSAGLDVPSSGDAASDEVVKGDDTRLSDSRPPTSHGHVVADVSDAGTAATKDVPSSGDAASNQVVKGDDSRLTDSRPPTAHAHDWSDITNKPTIPDEFPEGTVIMWVSAIGAIAVPAFDSSKWKRCEGGTITGGTYNGQAVPDYRDHFLRGSATSSNTSQGSDTHSHILSEENVEAEADAGNCVVVRSLTSGATSLASNVPKYKAIIYLLKYA